MIRGPGRLKRKRDRGREFYRYLRLDENGVAVAVSMNNGWSGPGGDGSGDGNKKGRKEEKAATLEAVGSSPTAPKAQLHRANREAAAGKKKGKAASKEYKGEDDPHLKPNLNRIKTLRARGPREMSRHEKQKKEEKDRYWELHLAGKTDEYKMDMARLVKIRKEIVEAQAKRKADDEDARIRRELRDRPCLCPRQRRFTFDGKFEWYDL
ncbi:hypothetical protein FRB98_008491 [Tulasnella sp. 332]|nr:hypothetical protein FRB98_008491 [Tulasnella sp. 332]